MYVFVFVCPLTTVYFCWAAQLRADMWLYCLKQYQQLRVSQCCTLSKLPSARPEWTSCCDVQSHQEISQRLFCSRLEKKDPFLTKFTEHAVLSAVSCYTLIRSQHGAVTVQQHVAGGLCTAAWLAWGDLFLCWRTAVFLFSNWPWHIGPPWWTFLSFSVFLVYERAKTEGSRTPCDWLLVSKARLSYIWICGQK